MKHKSVTAEVDDGLCAFELRFADDGPDKRFARPGQIRRAAEGMVRACKIANDEVKGGMARNIGKV